MAVRIFGAASRPSSTKPSLNGKAAEGLGKHLATLVVEALSTVSRSEGDIQRCSSEDVLIAKGRHNSISESRLLRGLIIDKRIELHHMKRALKDLKVATLTCPLVIEKTTRDAEIEITEVDQLSDARDGITPALSITTRVASIRPGRCR